MIKNLLLTFLLLSSIYCDCSTHITTSSCTSDQNCTWKPDTTKDKCVNLEVNCGTKSQADCKGTCTYTNEIKGGCSHQATYCTLLGDSFCKTSTICDFTPGAEICQDKTTGYGCKGFVTEPTCTAPGYCIPEGTCKAPTSACDTTNATTCQASSACDYKENRKEGCYPDENYCSDSACTANDPFCIKQIKSETCVDISLSYSCRRSYTDSTSCLSDPNCEWFPRDSVCSQRECGIITKEAECKTKSYCDWEVQFNCIADKTKCPFTTPQTTCDAIPPTSGATGQPCKFLDLDYTCTPKDLSKCPNYKNKQSCIDGGCDFTFSTCVDGDAQCGSKPLATCASTYSATCEKVNQKGSCADKLGACTSYTDSPTCGSNNCSWTTGTPASCTQTVSCSGLSETSCDADTINCSWIYGGTCISKTFDDIQNNALSQKLLQITLFVIIAMFVV
ncbi:hypothetical protein ABPG74_010666 [Tetrahymena malaccensis]